jgi:hypothetical protein
MWWLAIPLCLVVVEPSGGFEQETLYAGDIDHGGFGGPVVKMTQIADEFGVIVGARGGWIIDHSLIVGGGVYGMATHNMELDTEEIGGDPDLEYHLEMGYAGFELEYLMQPHRLVHASLHALIGGGGVAYLEGGPDGHWNDEDVDVLSSDGFFIAEPGMNLELNVARPFRVALGAGYRFVSDVDLPGLADDDLSGFTTTVALKFGSF